MHPKLTSSSTVLRKGDYKFLGYIFLAATPIILFVMVTQQSPWPGYIGPLGLLLLGVWFLRSDSRYILFIEGDTLYWADHEGEKTNRGEARIGDIAALEVYKLSRREGRAAEYLSVELVMKDGARSVLPNNLNFGGAGNPRYQDVLSALQAVNPAITVEVRRGKGHLTRAK